MSTFKDLWAALGCGTVLGLDKAMNSPRANAKAEKKMVEESGLAIPPTYSEETSLTLREKIEKEINHYCSFLPKLYKAIDWQLCVSPPVPPAGYFIRRKVHPGVIHHKGDARTDNHPTVDCIGFVGEIAIINYKTPAQCREQLRNLMQCFGAARNQYYVAPEGFYNGNSRYFDGERFTTANRCRVAWGFPVVVRTPEEIEFYDKVVERIIVISGRVLELCSDWLYLRDDHHLSNTTQVRRGEMTTQEYIGNFSEKVTGRPRLF